MLIVTNLMRIHSKIRVVKPKNPPLVAGPDYCTKQSAALAGNDCKDNKVFLKHGTIVELS